MRAYFALFLTFCVANAARVVLEPEQLVSAPEGWNAMKRRPDRMEKVELTIAITMQNIEEMMDVALRVSTPGDELYGKHWSLQQVAQLTSPKTESVDAVLSWAKSGGGECELTQALDFAVCTFPLHKAEELLGVRYQYFSHTSYGIVLRAVGSHYTVPSSLSAHIDFVSGVHRFPSVKHMKQRRTKEERLSLLRKGEREEGEMGRETLVGADPKSLRRMYNVTASGSNKSNSQSVAQFLNQHMSKADLEEFFFAFDEGISHVRDVDIVGPNGLIAGTEASLDIQYITALGNNIPTTFWSTGGTYKTQEPFLQWCLDVGNTTNPPILFSVSYGDDENTLSFDYASRVNSEFAKMALRGITVLFASGDSGTECTGGSNPMYVPNFPVSSPWVTAVGGTEGTSADYISGGGFSNYFPRPSYQNSAVLSYLGNPNNHVPNTKLFNTTGRAYPDLAAQSEGYTVVCNLIPLPGVAGTSCSTPVTGGIISLVNDLRLNNGKSPMGFLNVWLYQNPNVADDITQGCNIGCSQSDAGFCAVKGYDPVSGLGTPNYGLMAASAIIH